MSEPDPPTLPWYLAYFSWLLDRGFVIEETHSSNLGSRVTYGRGELVVYVTYDNREEVPNVAVARCGPSPVELQPWTDRVGIDELLEVRDPSGLGWRDRDMPLTHASDLLKTVASDILSGENLNVLDEVVAARRGSGLPR